MRLFASAALLLGCKSTVGTTDDLQWSLFLSLGRSEKEPEAPNASQTLEGSSSSPVCSLGSGVPETGSSAAFRPLASQQRLQMTPWLVDACFSSGKQEGGRGLECPAAGSAECDGRVAEPSAGGGRNSIQTILQSSVESVLCKQSNHTQCCTLWLLS